MRQALLACYNEFGVILKQMGITHVSVHITCRHMLLTF